MKTLLFSIAVVTVMSAIVLSGVSMAEIITVEPDDFAAEPRRVVKELTNVVPGVTLSMASNTGEATSTLLHQVVSIEGSNPSTGDWVFGKRLAGFVPNESFIESGFSIGISLLRADFDATSNYVAIDILDIGQRDSGTLRAFDEFDNLLESVTVTFGPGELFVTAEISRPTADISYILAAGSFIHGPPFPGVGLDNLRFAVDPEPTLVSVDIKPGSDINPINLISRGVIPVAILGSDTFDVLDVDVDTLAFGPAGAIGAAPVHPMGGHLGDVNDDGLTDLLSHYLTQETGITAEDAEACVVGETFDGTPIEGCDEILVLSSTCGLGFELALLLPGLMWLRQRRRMR